MISDTQDPEFLDGSQLSGFGALSYSVLCGYVLIIFNHHPQRIAQSLGFSRHLVFIFVKQVYESEHNFEENREGQLANC